MRLARKPVVKRIQTPINQSIKTVEYTNELMNDTAKPFLEITEKSFELYKIAINSMFLANGAAAMTLLNNFSLVFVNAILIFTVGAGLSITFSILLSILISPIENKYPRINVKLFTMIVAVFRCIIPYISLFSLFIPVITFFFGVLFAIMVI